MSEGRPGYKALEEERDEQSPSGLDRISEVARPGGARSPWVLAGGASALLVALVAILGSSSEGSESHREPERLARLQAPRLEPLPELALPAGDAGAAPEAPSQYAQQLAYELQDRALREADERRRRQAERRRSPIVLYDKSSEAPPEPAGRLGAGPREAWLQEGSGAGLIGGDAASRRRPAPRSGPTVAEGTLIEGILETAIQSDLPGRVRAQVSADVRAFDGSRVIPRGSRLVGRYDAGLVRGQTRIFVVWSRVLLPDGGSIELDSPGTDALGRAGVGGEVDTHFFEIFGASALLSLVDGGIDIAAARAQQSDGSTFVTSGGQDLSRAAEIALQDRVSIPPTVHVAAGTPIQVFVAKDLNLGQAAGRGR